MEFILLSRKGCYAKPWHFERERVQHIKIKTGERYKNKQDTQMYLSSAFTQHPAYYTFQIVHMRQKDIILYLNHSHILHQILEYVTVA